jgi:hypothetical protein
VDGRTLTRLRLAFIALGVVLLLPLALLVRSASERLEEQRKLKHEVVAERIFDEMERELVALLERERARSSDAYAATNTRPESWAPFVVGYFVHDAGGTRVTASELLTDERQRTVASAAELAWAQWSPVHGQQAADAHGPSPAAVAERERVDALLDQSLGAKAKEEGGKGAAKDDDLLNPYSKQEAVLRKLNRAQTKRRAAPKGSVDPERNRSYDDPLSGLDDL